MLDAAVPLVVGGLALPIILAWLGWVTRSTMHNTAKVAQLERDNKSLGRSIDQLRDTIGHKNGHGDLMTIVTTLLEQRENPD